VELARIAVLLWRSLILLSNTQLLHDAGRDTNIGATIACLIDLLVLVQLARSRRVWIDILAVSLEDHLD
jgi:hypothetical protein